MKLVCSQSDLKTNLSLVSRAVPSRPTHPVLGNVLFQTNAETQRITLTAFDLSLGLQTSFPAQVSDNHTFTLPAKLLSDIVSRLPEGEITLLGMEEEEEDNDSFSATLISASGRFRLRGMNADEYPNLPEINTEEALQVPVEALIDGLSSTLFAASTEEAKQVLTGVHLTRKEDSLEFAATDGHRLAVLETTQEGIEGASEGFAVTIPARALRELERMIKTQKEDAVVTMNCDEVQVAFELDSQRLTTRKLEGNYPAYNQLLPNQFSRQLSLERKRLLNSLELVAVLADQQNNVVKFSIDSENQQLSLSVDAKEVGSAQESISAEVTGDSIDIAFNVKYLMDGLKAFKGNEIQMQLNEASQPIIFTPLGGLKMTYLVMPVQLRD
ncbi:DNA polymerase III subunit beta [Euhalothece natronophila Z-M001]|uniref:Beta sliding clamp n=1 Tax=Euhalothece natronophila Z-M001 TaxID=522448 RepID=A0A5B8NQK0_9CHRO|nr:DNA polymerase III subunit beta [Euhalothece natronophila]QDZ41227.1 DNA polymerase III subunit beta [Euhalothece natronophila Z-M001]